MPIRNGIKQIIKFYRNPGKRLPKKEIAIRRSKAPPEALLDEVSKDNDFDSLI